MPAGGPARLLARSIKSITNRHFPRDVLPLHLPNWPVGLNEGDSTMSMHPARAGANAVGLRVAGVVAGTLVLLLALLAIARPEMMDMAMLHKLMSAVGL